MAAPAAPPAPLAALCALLEAQRWRWADASALVAAEVAGTPAEGSDQLVYGEARPEGVWALLDEFAPRFAARRGADGRAGAAFADVGAGCGKAVLAAALHPGVRAAHGVELVRATHAVACALAAEVRRAGLLARTAPRVRFRRACLLAHTAWTRADIVLANCVTWCARAARAQHAQPRSAAR
jgi:hypothetical protein